MLRLGNKIKYQNIFVHNNMGTYCHFHSKRDLCEIIISMVVIMTKWVKASIKTLCFHAGFKRTTLMREYST